MYYLSTEHCFDSAHFLKDYDGKCRNLHGHRWRVVVEISGASLVPSGQARGMLVDFGDLKRDVRALCDQLDHSLIYETGSLRPATLAALQEEKFRLIEVPFRPTAEEFSRYFFEQIQQKGYAPHRVMVYETPTNCAAYEAPCM